MHVIPTGVTGKKGSLEELRKKFNEEQNVQTVCSTETAEAGIISTNAVEQVSPIVDISIRQDRPKRTRRTHKSATRKAGDN